MILPFLSQKFTHDWQVHSVCCKKQRPYEQEKEFNDFQFYSFPFKPEKTQIKIYAFLNHFSILCISELLCLCPVVALKSLKCSYYFNPQGLHLQSFFILHKKTYKALTELTEPRHQPSLHDVSGRLSTFVLPLFLDLSSTRLP